MRAARMKRGEGVTINCVIMIGNLTRDPETKTMTNGKPRTMFTLAVTREYTNAQGMREADFITFIAYEKNAELVVKYLSKGRKCAVRGHVKTGSYEKDGQRYYTTEYVADKIEFLSPPNTGQPRDADEPEEASQGIGAGAPANDANANDEDDLPF